MEQLHTRNKRYIIILVLALLILFLALLMAKGYQVTLPMAGVQTNRQMMPPDPENWCKKVDLNRLDTEITKAELFLEEGVGQGRVDWRYLRRALKHTGVQVSGPEDAYWLNTIQGLYSGCTR